MNLKAIYCVDDDDVINKVLLFQISKFIEHEEIVVETCNHPKECVEMMKENYRLGIEPLVCVVDFQMPEMRGDEFARIVKSLFPKIKITVPSELNFTSSGLLSRAPIATDFSKVAEVISKAVVRLYCNILSAPIPVIYILVPSGLNVIPVALPSSLLILKSAINVGSAKASDEKNKLNKTKNTFSLRAPFIINFLLFFIKLSILIYLNLYI